MQYLEGESVARKRAQDVQRIVRWVKKKILFSTVQTIICILHNELVDFLHLGHTYTIHSDSPNDFCRIGY